MSAYAGHPLCPSCQVTHGQPCGEHSGAPRTPAVPVSAAPYSKMEWVNIYLDWAHSSIPPQHGLARANIRDAMRLLGFPPPPDSPLKGHSNAS